jgi:hypothetical protein
MVGLILKLRAFHESLEEKVHQRTVLLTEEMAKREFLEKALLAASEREQRRIGQDLHDSLCQHLTGTALAGRVLTESLHSRLLPEAVDADRIVCLVEEGIDLAKRLAQGLVPIELEMEGLSVALDRFAHDTSRRFKIECRFEAPDHIFIEDSAVALHLYRVAQEATSNAIRHGNAKSVLIRVILTEEGICLCIEDDGLGFQSGSLPNQAGMGIQIMRHRIAMIGGSFSLTKLQRGVLVKCFLSESDSNKFKIKDLNEFTSV